MKNILIGIILFMSSCSIYPKIDKDFQNYRLAGWHVLRDDVIVATVTNIEYELSPKGKMIREISLTVSQVDKINITEDVLYFVGQRFPKSKIELNLDGIIDYIKMNENE